MVPSSFETWARKMVEADRRARLEDVRRRREHLALRPGRRRDRTGASPRRDA
jgi:hypothetical protein